MVNRLFIYLDEMFPWTSFVGSMLTAVSVQLIYIRLYGYEAQFRWQMILSGLVITFISLLIRVMDEFKDLEDDKRNFPLRPLPSGRVKAGDLKVLAWICIGVVLGLSLHQRDLFYWSCLSLGFTFLMLKWFFIEEMMRKSLPLAFISHHPIVLFNFVYLLLGMIVSFPDVGWDKALYVLPNCLLFTNWEVARKIRMPQEETGYTTYSKIFGPRVAVSISLTLQAIYLGALDLILMTLESPLPLMILANGLMFILMYPYLRFLMTLKLSAPLKPNAENQILLVMSVLMMAAFL